MYRRHDVKIRREDIEKAWKVLIELEYSGDVDRWSFIRWDNNSVCCSIAPHIAIRETLSGAKTTNLIAMKRLRLSNDSKRLSLTPNSLLLIPRLNWSMLDKTFEDISKN